MIIPSGEKSELESTQAPSDAGPQAYAAIDPSALEDPSLISDFAHLSIYLQPPQGAVDVNPSGPVGSSVSTEGRLDSQPPPAYDSLANAQATIIPVRDAETVRRCFAAPSTYVGPSLRPGLYPHYSSSDSFDTHPPPVSNRPASPSQSPPKSLFALIGGRMTPPSPPVTPSAPLPSSFSRPAPRNLPYSVFSPAYLISNGTRLNEGFPVLPPESIADPHPFTTHDVNEADWARWVKFWLSVRS